MRLDVRLVPVLVTLSLAWGWPVPARAQAADEAAAPGWVDWVGDGLGALVGPWIHDEVFGVRWLALGTSLTVLILVGLADAVLRGLIRRRVRRDERLIPSTGGGGGSGSVRA